MRRDGSSTRATNGSDAVAAIVAAAAISAERSQRKATNGSGSYQFRAGARTGSRAVAGAVPVNKNMK
ncbi:MAG: hypothetical protein IIY32_07740 [Thermoguttaceae bacterium]|nr:hypothetical protein [Thermoguttaceae bacterium]